MRIYIHIPIPGIYVGNGGQVTLFALAHALLGMGHDVALFAPRPLPEPPVWDWLSHSRFPFERVTLADVLADTSDYRAISLRLETLDPALRAALGNGALAWARERLRYWCNDELLRDGPTFERCREFARLLPAEHIVVTNPHLAWSYEQLGFRDVAGFEPWIPQMFHADPVVRVPGRVGYMPDNGPADLLQAGGIANGFTCAGSRAEVAAQMRTCDWFVWWNGPKYMVHFEGEGFGLSLYEAMASGCVVLPHTHAGNRHLRAIMPATVMPYDTLAQVCEAIRHTTPSDKEALRERQLALIERDYRWDRRRRQAIEEWLQ